MWLTLATFVGYAIIYTVLLKPATPQNIVIGGASGAMPPVLGWAAVTNDVAPEALLLFLIIFAWTPPHFWSLALYRTRGLRDAPGCRCCRSRTAAATRGCMIVLYTVALVARHAAAVRDPDERLHLPRAARWRWAACSSSTRSRSTAHYSDELARATFRYSIVYLAGAVLGAAGRPLLAVSRACAASCRSPRRRSCRLRRGGRRRSSRPPTSPAASFGRDFSLTDARGKPRTLADYRGKAVVVFFGYTQCPDVMPDDARRRSPRR
mgnify:CR=1 FL=1